MTSLSSLTPASVGKAATLDLSAGTVTRSDIIRKWFNTLSDSSPLKLYRLALGKLFDKYISKIVDFLQPVLINGFHSNSPSESDVSLVSGVTGCTLQGQDLRMSEIHLMQSLCTMLEVSVTKICSYVKKKLYFFSLFLFYTVCSY